MIADSSQEIHTQNGFSTAPANDDSPIEGLSARHYRMLHNESGISDDMIRERGYRTCTGHSELKSLNISVRRDTDTRGLLLPLHTTDGRQVTIYFRDETAPFTIYRPDEPQYDKNNKIRKYLLPTGARMRLDCPPRCRPALTDPTIPLWITEGQKKGDALASHGACAIALLGVTCWRGTNAEGGKAMLPDWEDIALNDRDVRIVFDNDVMTKKGVRHTLERLAMALQNRGALVSVAYLPASGKKIGVDDYLLEHSMQDLEQCLHQGGQPQKQEPAPSAAGIALKVNEYGRPRPILWNVMAVLAQDPAWQGALKRNQLTGKVELHRVPPGFSPDPWTPRPIEDVDLVNMACWLQEKYDLYASTALVHEAVNAMASRCAYHPVRIYLEGLTWDGTSRLDTWLIRHCHVEDTPYSRAVGSKTLISAVARVMQPGCKVDTMLILQGEQGFLKSEALRRVASDAWFKDDMPRDLGHKDAKAYLQDAWVIEFAELSQFKRSEIEEVKAFVTTRQDTFRHAYGRVDHSYPRQCIFVATTNQDIIFHDETGNRRFWPVKVHATCDVNGIDQEHDQLWAEAMVRYRAGEPWYLTGDLEKAAQAEQESRVMQDDWADVILDYLRTASLRTATYQHHATVFVTGSELLGQAIGLEKTLWNLAASHRIGRIMRLLHWRTVRIDNPERGEGQARQLRVFIPPQPEPETLETVDSTSSVTSADPHKTLLETLETLETVDIERVSESMDGMSDCPKLGNFPGQTGFLGKFKKSTDTTVSNVSDSVTSEKPVPSSETLATPSNVSISQPSVSESQPSLTRLTPADPCPQCGHNAMQPYKEPHKLLCFRCGGIIPTTWEG